MSEPDTSSGLMSEPKYRLRRQVFDAHAAEKGAPTINSQVALSGVPRASLVRIRRGETPSLHNAVQLANALGVSVAVLFELVNQ